MDSIIAVFNQILDFFKNNESIAKLIEMVKGYIEQFMYKTELITEA
jgi:hypothetical protein